MSRARGLLHALAVCLALLTLPTMAAAPIATTLTSVGSDTLGNLMLAWAQAYRQEHAGTRFQIHTPGSAGAPAALINGSADIGPMSREMSSREELDYLAAHGQPPGRLRVALDAVVVFVHPDNPLPSLTLAQIADVWATAGTCPGQTDTTTWADLGITTAPLAQRRVLRLGRNTASGTHEYLRTAALCNGDFRDDVVQFPGAGAIVAAVAQQPHAIGHAGIGHSNGLVKIVPIRVQAGVEAIAPTPANIISRRYPLSRSLYIYFNRDRNGRADPASAAFLRYVLSAPAQELVARQGFIALPADELVKELGQLQ